MNSVPEVMHADAFPARKCEPGATAVRKKIGTARQADALHHVP